MAEIKSTTIAFEALPESVKDWLASERLTYLIIDINRRLGLRAEKQAVIPNLIFRLATRDLNPKNFINELSQQLNLSFSSAKALVHELEEKILKPIEISLRNKVGVDVKSIYLGEPEVVEKKPPVAIISPPTSPTRVAPPPPPIRVEPPKIPSAPSPEATAGDAKPFILHEEAPMTKPSEVKPSITLKVPITVKPSAPKITHKPLEAITPKESENQSNNKPRNVHYSNFKTQLKS